MQSHNNNYKILLFNSTLGIDVRTFKNLTLVNSPIDCLHKATENIYDLVAILHEHRLFRERDALVELCSILKRNIHTMHIPILLLLPTRHRKLLQLLQDTGVEYAMFYDPGDPDLMNHMESLLVDLPEECKIDGMLSDICPHINYFPIFGQKEILYCGAYRNRLVLGPYRLRHLCEISDHKICQYFKCPKFF